MNNLCKKYGKYQPHIRAICKYYNTSVSFALFLTEVVVIYTTIYAHIWYLSSFKFQVLEKNVINGGFLRERKKVVSIEHNQALRKNNLYKRMKRISSAIRLPSIIFFNFSELFICLCIYLLSEKENMDSLCTRNTLKILVKSLLEYYQLLRRGFVFQFFLWV